MPMGFGAVVEGKKQTIRTCAGPCAITFDSGTQIALADLATHALIQGSTGTGKTTGPASEIVRNAIHAALPLVIVDVKCNLGDRIRAFAAECGREGDIIEYGSYPSATSINILAGKDAHELYEFYLEMLNSVVPMDHNRSFHLKGVKYAADCATFLRYLEKIDLLYAPTVPRITDMLANPDMATKIFRLWKDKYMDKDDIEQAAFVASCESDQFHPLNRPEKKFPSSSTSSANATICEQYSYATHALNSAMGPLVRSPGFIENFSRASAPSPDFAAAYRDNRIIHIRFEPSCGQSGALLSRLLLSQAYKSLYEVGLELKKQIIFFCDEFQTFCDLSGARFSDSGFVERAREYGGSLVACTQSASGLASRFGATAAAAFYSNINTLISLYTTDPLSCAIAKQHDPGIELASLRFGEAFVKTLSLERKSHEHSVEGVNQAWERCQQIAPIASMPREKGEHEATFAELASFFEKKAADKPAPVQSEPQKKESATMPKRFSYESGEPSPPDAFCQELIRDFPALFAQDAKGPFAVPLGWRHFVRRAFEMAAALDMKGAINALFPGYRGHLDVSYAGPHLPLLAMLLKRTQFLCKICGEDTSLDLGVCERCMDRYGIPVTFDDDDDFGPHAVNPEEVI